MSAADCPTCEALGYRACDVCGVPVSAAADAGGLVLVRDGFGRELCLWCAGR